MKKRTEMPILSITTLLGFQTILNLKIKYPAVSNPLPFLAFHGDKGCVLRIYPSGFRSAKPLVAKAAK
jgi:hypothetical protein